MKPWEIILLIVAIYVLIIFLYSLFVYLLVQKTIARRMDKNPLFKYFTADDYIGLKATPLSFKNRKGVTLNGFVYEREDALTNAVIVFFHGHAAGHLAYTTLINDLVTKTRYEVLTFDYMGCDLSEGKKMPNMSQALSDGHDFLAYIKTLDDYKDKPLILIGHSWGGYVASNLYPLNKDKMIIKIVSINGLTDIALMFKKMARAPFMFIPLYNTLTSFHYGKLAFKTTRKSIKDTPVPHLFIHGEKDDSVPLMPFVSSLVLQSDKHKRIKFHFESDRYHNVYLTKESELKLRDLLVLVKNHNRSKNKSETEKAILNFPFDEAVINDHKILSIIDDFIKESVS